jgi:DNA polymerase-1
MKHIIFDSAPSYQTALLIKDTNFNQHELLVNYVQPLNAAKVQSNCLIAFTLKTGQTKTTPNKLARDYLDQLLPVLDGLGVKILYVAEPTYFKILTKLGKTEPHFGYVLPCKYPGYEHFKVILGLNHQALIYNPALSGKLTLSLTTLASAMNNSYVALGHGIIHSAQYPETLQAISRALLDLHQYESLSCDIEAFSLRFNKAGIGTIAFAWDQHNGLAFACDYFYFGPNASSEKGFGEYWNNHDVQVLLKEFFVAYTGTITWHNATYDLKVLIYSLWMKHPLDTEGLLEGLEIMTRHFNDTKIVAYLATNSTAGNVLGLKSLAHEFAGNWAKEDIKDISRIPLPELLQYNLVDALSTHFVLGKYYPVMQADKQEDLYKSLMLPSLKLIIQMELTGMPMSEQAISDVKADLLAEQAKHLSVFDNNGLIKAFNLIYQTSVMQAANAKLKVKQHPLSKYSDVAFNPNSNPQLQVLLYEQMGLPVIDLTDTKQPSTGADTIEKLLNHTKIPSYKTLLEAIIGYGKVTKILSTFIPAFERGLVKDDGMRYLHGSFNLGGTVSGRLSSSDPNMQNLPANSTFGKSIKECFQAPPGWILAGADFNSLEDYVSALTTKDPNKLKVYTDGYDGHCLRAYSYFKDQCPDIVDTVASINSMKKLYPEFRQESKTATFALSYQGTWRTLVNSLGFSEAKAKDIEAGYHTLYKASDEFIQARLEQASKDGFVDVAFGLRVRTPLLKQVVFGSAYIPFEAQAEGRTAGNAMGQSYGLLNNRAAVDFMQKVWASKYRLDIKPVAMIHDAIYILIRDVAETVYWANTELIKSMQWQELPELLHDTVKLGAALDLYWPSWAHAVTLPNKASEDSIRELCHAAKVEHKLV